MTRGAGGRVLISAGEPSADLHAARVLGELRAQRPGVRCLALGGTRLAAAGAEVRWRLEDYSAFGLVEVIGAIPRHWRLLADWRRRFDRGEVDLVMLVDYPGFHLRVAEAARAAGVPVLYYIAPQLWAWGASRAERFAAAVDRLAVILPFEEAFFRERGIAAEYVGHPLCDGPAWPGRVEARRELGLDPAARVLAVLPGSRSGEVARLWPPMRGAALRLLDAGRVDRVLVAGTPGGRYPEAGPIGVVRDRSRLVMAAADAALAKSGTTTLECGLAGLPMVVAYAVHPVTGLLAARLVQVEHVSLVNLVAGRRIVPELLQGAVTAERLAAEAAPLLVPGSAPRLAQLAGLAELRARLGGEGAAARVAEMAGRLLDR